MATWSVVQPGIPEVITDVASAIDSVADALLAVLDIALQILEVLKAFLIGLIDPIAALVQALIAEVEGLLNDLRQLGVYVSGDFNAQWPFDELQGGYPAYERRMIARFVDRTDPTRPSFSPRSVGLAIFFYASGDASQIPELIKLTKRLAEFFGDRTEGGQQFTVPVDLRVTYGRDGAPLSQFGALMKMEGSSVLVPNAANIRWSMAPPVTRPPIAWQLPSPSGFLVQVSTVRDGLLVAWEAPTKNALIEENGETRAMGLVQDPYGRTFRLFGGKDLLDLDIPEAVENGTLKPGAARVYGLRDVNDTIPIPLADLKDGEKYLLQRTFYVDAKQGSSSPLLTGPGQGWAVTLNHDDMPWEAEFTEQNGVVTATAAGNNPATTVYVRVAAVSEDVVSENSFQWSLTTEIVNAQAQAGKAVRFESSLSPTVMGEVSAPLTVTFPNTETTTYLDTVATALAVLVLSRPDLPVITDAEKFVESSALNETGLENLAKYLMPKLVGRTPGQFYKKVGLSPLDTRRDIMNRCRLVANELYRQTGNMGSSIESIVNARGLRLRTFLWSEADSRYPGTTILDSLDTTISSDDETGLALNPLSIGIDEDSVSEFLDDLAIARFPSFNVKANANPTFVAEQGSCDYAPVLFARDGLNITAISYARNLLVGEPDVLEAAAEVLGIAAAPMTLTRKPGEGAWRAFRLLPQGLPGIEQMLDEVLRWAQNIEAGIKAVTDLITAYIDFIESRIMEIQSLIVRINGLIQAILNLQMPAVGALVVTGYGTDELLSEFIVADNKPSDVPTNYSAGAVLVAGGLPGPVIDLLAMFFPESEE